MQAKKSQWLFNLAKVLPVSLPCAGFGLMAYIRMTEGSGYDRSLFGIAIIMTWAFISTFFFLMVHTGRTGRYRTVPSFHWMTFLSRQANQRSAAPNAGNV